MTVKVAPMGTEEHSSMSYEPEFRALYSPTGDVLASQLVPPAFGRPLLVVPDSWRSTRAT